MEKPKMQRDSFTCPQDRLNYCQRKVNYIRDSLAWFEKDRGHILSEIGLEGLLFILGDIEDDLETVSDELDNERKLTKPVEAATAAGKI